MAAFVDLLLLTILSGLLPGGSLMSPPSKQRGAADIPQEPCQGRPQEKRCELDWNSLHLGPKAGYT